MAASPREIERVYHARYGGFLRAVSAIAGEQDAHDAVQEGFARALERRRRFRDGSLEAWVWKAVLRRAFDERRRRAALPLAEDLDPGGLVVRETLALDESAGLSGYYGDGVQLPLIREQGRGGRLREHDR